MFGFLKNGFSLTDLPSIVKAVDDSWKAHLADVEAEFGAVKNRLTILEEKLGIVSQPPASTNPTPVNSENANHA